MCKMCKKNNKKSPKSTAKSNKVQQHVTVVTDVADNLNYFTQRVNTPGVIIRPCKKIRKYGKQNQFDGDQTAQQRGLVSFSSTDIII